MPKLKQPIPLQKLAFDYVVECTVCHCDALSIKGLLTELRESLAVIKQHVSDNVPGVIFMEFCRRFLHKFFWIGYRMPDKRPDSHNSAAVEMIMDVQFDGLICEGDILDYVNPVDVHRLQGLKTLDWSQLEYRRSPVPRGLENYRLQDLTTFIFPRMCTDPDLEIIGQRCLKLQVLRVEESGNVTDKGLRALRPCSELRIINLRYCPVMFDDCVNELLNVHKKLEQFDDFNFYVHWEKSFDVLSRPISLVCPSVKRFALKSDPVTNAHLHAVVALFPNLTHLQFCVSVIIGDLCILKDLKSLARLEFDQVTSFTMKNLKDLLTSVGGNISQLAVMYSDICLTQNDLIFLSKYCRNIEKLYFLYEPNRALEKLIVPSFPELKNLECHVRVSATDYCVELELSEMLKLEVLKVDGFHGTLEMTESMMFDNVKFPNLRKVDTFHLPYEVSQRIMKIAKENNLDFLVE